MSMNRKERRKNMQTSDETNKKPIKHFDIQKMLESDDEVLNKPISNINGLEIVDKKFKSTSVNWLIKFMLYLILLVSIPTISNAQPRPRRNYNYNYNYNKPEKIDLEQVITEIQQVGTKIQNVITDNPLYKSTEKVGTDISKFAVDNSNTIINNLDKFSNLYKFSFDITSLQNNPILTETEKEALEKYNTQIENENSLNNHLILLTLDYIKIVEDSKLIFNDLASIYVNNLPSGWGYTYGINLYYLTLDDFNYDNELKKLPTNYYKNSRVNAELDELNNSYIIFKKYTDLINTTNDKITIHKNNIKQINEDNKDLFEKYLSSMVVIKNNGKTQIDYKLLTVSCQDSSIINIDKSLNRVETIKAQLNNFFVSEQCTSNNKLSKFTISYDPNSGNYNYVEFVEDIYNKDIELKSGDYDYDIFNDIAMYASKSGMFETLYTTNDELTPYFKESILKTHIGYDKSDETIKSFGDMFSKEKKTLSMVNKLTNFFTKNLNWNLF